MILFLVIQLLHLLILSPMEFVAYPEFFVYPYLTSSGWLPYRQIIDQHFPGLFFMPVNFFTLGFINPRSLKILSLLLVIFQSALIYRIAKSISSRVYPLIAMVTFALWQPFFSGNHLWLESLISPLALTSFYLWRNATPFWSGAALGAAILFKQSVALPIFILILITYFRRGFKSALTFAAGAVLPLTLAVCYFGYRGVLSDFFFWTVKFNFLYAVQAATVPDWTVLFKLLLPALLFILALFKSQPKRVVLVLAVWGLILIPGGLSRFDFTRLQAIVPFLSLSLGLLITSLWSAKKYFLFSVILVAQLAWFSIFYIRQENWGQYRFFDQSASALVQTVTSLTSPGDEIFLLGVQPHLYMLSGTYPPGSHFSYQLPWYLPFTQNRILYSLASDPPQYIFYDAAASVDGKPISEYAAPLIQYVKHYYSPISAIGSVTVYESRY